MPTAAEHLEIVAPYLWEPDDPRGATEAQRAWGLAVAEAWRPVCLPVETQNLAQAYRAAFEISALKRMQAAQAAVATVGVAGAVVRRREGNVEVQYSDGKTQAVVSTGADTGPGTPYALWKELWARCQTAATGEDGQPIGPPRRGGIAVGHRRYV